jgi:hypothetical protein
VSPRSRPALTALIVLLAATLASSCQADAGSDRTSFDPPRGDRARRAHAAVAGLCEAIERAGDRPAARTVFYNQSHDGLHTLNAIVEARDRKIAARLAEAKNTVETAFLYPDQNSQLKAHLAALLTAATDALTASGIQPPACAQ